LAKPFTITVTNVNEAPTNVSLSGSTAAENAAGTVIGAVTGTDPDAGDSHVFLVSDSRFEVLAGQLRLKAGQSLDFEVEPSINLTITARDSGGLELVRPFTITVTNVNEAPTSLSLAGSTVPENSAGAAIGAVTGTDPDAGDTLVFLVSDSRFEVAGGQLRLKAGQSLVFAAEPTVNLTLTARDAGGLELSQLFTINVLSGNRPPTSIGLSATAVAENSAGAVVGNVSVTDPDAGDSHVVTVSDARFEVVQGQLKLKPGQSLDFEAGASIPLDLTARDAGGLAITRPFTIQVLDANDPPSSVGLSNQKVRERLSGETVGVLLAVDPDAGQTHNFAVNDSRFEVVGNLLKLKAGEYLDRAVEASVTIAATATDNGTPPAIGVQTFTLDVEASPHPWQNPDETLDTNNDLPDHSVVALDALIIFNLLNNPTALIDATGRLPVARPADSQLPFYDPSGDGFCTSLDALLIINDLNNRTLDGEGESPAAANSAASRGANISEGPSVADLESLLSAIAGDVVQVQRTARRRGR
jgi:hypothetical protein